MTCYEELFRESIGNITVIGCINDTEGDEPLCCSVDVYEDGPCDAMLISSEGLLGEGLGRTIPVHRAPGRFQICCLGGTRHDRH